MRTIGITLLLLFFPYCIWGQKKIHLAEQVVCSAKGWKDIKPVFEIINRMPQIVCYIPLGNPIKEENHISSRYGYRKHPISKKKKLHAGIDLVAEYASIVYATAKGKVTLANYKGGYGKMVIISHRYGFETRYAHLTHIYTTEGAEVEKGAPIGFVGSTGNSTGNHLHYEIRKNNIAIDPFSFITVWI